MDKRIIIAGGGTGGHIFPAVSIAQELQRREPQTEVLFVGAKGGMEMRVVPRYGYEIKPVWISGIHRKINLRNIRRNALFPIKLITSFWQSRRILHSFRPQLAVGVGGYASGPLGRMAASKGIPLVLCEQNAFPGLVNRWLAPKAQKILLGNADAGKYFDSRKVVVTGNPIRSFPAMSREEASAKMGVDASKPVILSLGGSLGARSVNEALLHQLDALISSDVQLVWQCGKQYYEELKPLVEGFPQVKLMAFIEDMATAYAAADLIISRAGGSTISELIALAKPSILVPSPNVAEDHQTKNALSLTEKGAALLVKDADAKTDLLLKAIEIVGGKEQLAALQAGINALEKHDAAKEIVDQIYALL